ncbi:MAG: hypothetical protein WAQ05_11525 [Rubrivivax sp.]
MFANVHSTLLGQGLTMVALAALTQPSQAAEVVRVVKDATLTCAKNFEFKDGACTADAAAVAKLGKDECKGPGLAFVGDTPKCFVVAEQIPAPVCSGAAEPTEFDKSLKQCVVRGDPLRSALTDFMGDCYRIRGLPKPSPAGLKHETTYHVRFQRTEGASDKLLTLAESADKGTLGCSPKPQAELFTVRASELQAIGADRAGWAFGVLALPYKLYTDDRSFGSSTSIGPYIGRRWGTPGSAYTFALAATIGSVKGEVRDAQDKIVETPDLQAFSLATGFSFDVSKSPDVRPFKVGFFVGADVVGSGNAVKYKHNRKPWIAFQIGYDFLD